MMANPLERVFHGSVKYSGTGMMTGSVKWKTGSLKIETEDETSWKIKMIYACSNVPCLTLPLTSSTVMKVNSNGGSMLIELRRGSGGIVTLYYRPDLKSDIGVIKDLLNRVPRANPTATMMKSVVGITGRENSLSNGYNDSHEKENCAQSFTSVKSPENKENSKSSVKPGESFLQRSAEKSRSCLSTLSGFYGKSAKSTSSPLHTSTPSRWLNSYSKRTPGLMPDPTPVKRARLSDSISYSMKVKPPQPTETTQSQALQGFSNLGNTCYMNAILQCLFGLETLATDLTSNKRMLKSFQQHSLYHALVKLLYVKRQTNATDISKRDALRRVKCAISNTAKRFSGYGQHDAHEFLGQVLDQLKEEVIKVSKSTPTPNKENENNSENRPDSLSSGYPGQNPITVNFEFEVEHTITCLQCKDEVSKTEQFHDISLDVPKQKDLFTPRSIQDALTLFFRNEEIEYTCEKCGHSKSNVSHKISRLPRVFILHLKRYSYNHLHSKNTKKGQNVRVPFYLTLQHHCDDNTQPPFPPSSIDNSASEQKLCQSVLDDVKNEDTPSRRKLEYSGFGFKKPPTETSTDTENPFTETKEKKDEVDSAIQLDYEEDPDLSRAIQMSLQEQDEKNKTLDTFGEDSDSQMEKVLELSRQEQSTPRVKKVQEMTEDEMIQFAIEQSLLEHDHTNDNITHNDDVITMSDHMYTTNYNNHDSANRQRSESYDIGPDFVSTSVKSNSRNPFIRKRHKSDSDIEDQYRNSSETIERDFDTVCGINKKKSNTVPVINIDSSASDDDRVTESQCDSNNKCRKDLSESFSKTSDKKQNVRRHSTTDHTMSSSEDDNDGDSVHLDLTCEEDLPDDFEIEAESEKKVKEENKDKTDVKNDLNKSIGTNTDIKMEDVFGVTSNSESDTMDSVDGNHGNKDDSDGFQLIDEDDSWLANIEDKENKIPLTQKPKLTDPNDYTMDTSEQTTIEKYVDENLDIPEIKNEKGELPYTYRLVSIVNHMGLSSAAGHYISDVFDMKKKSWYSFDDTHVTKITEADVKSKREHSGYIFFYMDKDIYNDLSLDMAVSKTARKT